MRLGDLDALKEKLQEHHDFFVNAWGGFSNLPKKDKARVDEITHCIAEVVNSPTIDAVPVVRCKDCKHCRNTDCGYMCKFWVDWLPTEDDDFCSYGERRGDG